ncbi:YfbM family protein [Streptosporangium sp. NBC_01495]|uniref:DUF1877 family protein n=1 Tax=Streptosporangium sp. NBC_01495 TaxID=2903899 RepID=UPI002E301211|nr:DUF1877 family protein [Streptosporangium sp. NBC_01495]
MTQQLARISAAQLEACQQSVDELERLCSFEVAPQTDHLDLDWAPEPLLWVCALTCADDALAVLRRALSGDGEVNSDYRDHPGAVWGQPVTFLSPVGVAAVALALRKMDSVMVAALSSHGAEASAVAVEMLPGIEEQQAYLLRHFAALLAFYVKAARRGLAVVLWWD